MYLTLLEIYDGLSAPRDLLCGLSAYRLERKPAEIHTVFQAYHLFKSLW